MTLLATNQVGDMLAHLLTYRCCANISLFFIFIFIFFMLFKIEWKQLRQKVKSVRQTLTYLFGWLGTDSPEGHRACLLPTHS